MNGKLPTLKECAEKRINHVVCETAYGLSIYAYGDTEAADRICGRNTQGEAYEIIDSGGHPAAGGDCSIAALTDEQFYAIYATCKYAFTQSADDPEVYECAALAPSEPPRYTPCCRFCGQSTLPERDFFSQAEADEHAALHCDCGGAKEYQEECRRKNERQKSIDRAKETIGNFYDYCESKGQPLTDEIKVILFSCSVLAIDGNIESAAINFGKIKSKLKINEKGTVTVVFSYSDSVKMEA
ncbi:MAG: hypothetical protein LBL66_04900 [Clostridiales bacterium]|jgi:hypothetical protein|nr:hypothetical protein [Clostridiales bacterium]